MKNEELLDELKKLFETFNEEATLRAEDFAYWKGQVAEMQRHNGRVVKILAATITGLLSLLGVLAYILQHLAGKIP